MRAQFVLSEIRVGLRRNLTMTLAVVVSVAVALTLAGIGLLMHYQVQTMKGYWYDKVEVSVFLCGATDQSTTCRGAVTSDQRNAIKADLEKLPQTQRVFYESQQDALVHFKEQFKNSPLIDSITADALPESFRVKLKDPRQFEVVASAFSTRPGVYSVQDQRELLRPFFTLLTYAQRGAVAIALIVLGVAGLLIVNTVRVSAFTRRRETGIMRLVGASNLYIQLPFLLEGAIAGLAGAVCASGFLVALQSFVVEGTLRHTFQTFAFIGWDAVLTIIPVLFVLGVTMSSLASFVTLRKYLKV
jgi:cell division transport system permease protein